MKLKRFAAYIVLFGLENLGAYALGSVIHIQYNGRDILPAWATGQAIIVSTYAARWAISEVSETRTGRSKAE